MLSTYDMDGKFIEADVGMIHYLSEEPTSACYYTRIRADMEAYFPEAEIDGKTEVLVTIGGEQLHIDDCPYRVEDRVFQADYDIQGVDGLVQFKVAYSKRLDITLKHENADQSFEYIHPEDLRFDLEERNDATHYYAHNANPEQAMDIYVPKDNQAQHPAVISIHGGSWCAGDRVNAQYLSKPLLEKGIVHVNFNHRLVHLLRGKSPTMADMLKDIDMAIDYLLLHQEEFKIDPKRIALWGYSSGAHLALKYASRYQGRVHAIIDEAGPTYFRPAELEDELTFDPRIFTSLTGVPYEQYRERMDEICQILSIDKVAEIPALPPIVGVYHPDDPVVDKLLHETPLLSTAKYIGVFPDRLPASCFKDGLHENYSCLLDENHPLYVGKEIAEIYLATIREVL